MMPKVGYKHLVLHRLLLGKLDRKHIDHANLVKSDNRRKNLRFCEPIQNCELCSSIRK